MAAFPTQLEAITPMSRTNLAHLRMGTSNVSKLQFMGKNECYTRRGFDNVFTEKHYGRCTTCDRARMRQRISHIEVERSTIVGKTWFADVSGPFHPSIMLSSGKGGYTYLVIFVEGASGTIITYGAPNKSDVEMLKISARFERKFLAIVRSRGVVGIQLQSDNGEFATAKIQAFWATNGVYQRFTSPYHSSSNGRAERAIGNVKAMGRVLLAHAELGEDFWYFAAMCAAFLINRTPYKLDGKYVREPWYQFFRTTANYAFFRVFGSPCILLDNNRLKDWNLPGSEAIMVGYENDVTYQVYEKSTNKVVNSSNVSFHEHLISGKD